MLGSQRSTTIFALGDIVIWIYIYLLLRPFLLFLHLLGYVHSLLCTDPGIFPFMTRYGVRERLRSNVKSLRDRSLP